MLSTAGVALSQSSGLMPDTTKAKSATGSVFAILDRKSKIDASDLSGITPERVKGFIEFKHVSFRYPSRPDIQIFQDLCLTIQAGKVHHDHHHHHSYHDHHRPHSCRPWLWWEKAAAESQRQSPCSRDSTTRMEATFS